MKLKKGKITFSYPYGPGERVLNIELIDSIASTTFAIATLNADQLMSVMGGLAHSPCEIKVMGLDRVGKKMEHKTEVLPIGKASYGKDNKANAMTVFKNHFKDSEWKPDFYFDSQNSFYTEGGVRYARCIVRRWVDEDAEVENG